MKNPYKVPSSQMVRMNIHKDLATAIRKEKNKQQRICNMKFSTKFKVPMSYASKVLGGLLK